MSAQAERTPEITGFTGSQITPVIIKTGGDTGGDTGGNTGGDVDPSLSPVTINLKGKVFDSPIKNDEWRSAKSGVKAGIQSLSITDGGKDRGTKQATAEGEELITLQIICGTEMLVMREERVEPHRTTLEITSPVPFTVSKPGPCPDQWIEATAWFPANNPLIILTQGDHVLVSHQCETDDVELLLGLDWDETGG
jgi:hypothetical protein